MLLVFQKAQNCQQSKWPLTAVTMDMSHKRWSKRWNKSIRKVTQVMLLVFQKAQNCQQSK